MNSNYPVNSKSLLNAHQTLNVVAWEEEIGIDKVNTH